MSADAKTIPHAHEKITSFYKRFLVLLGNIYSDKVAKASEEELKKLKNIILNSSDDIALDLPIYFDNIFESTLCIFFEAMKNNRSRETNLPLIPVLIISFVFSLKTYHDSPINTKTIFVQLGLDEHWIKKLKPMEYQVFDLIDHNVYQTFYKSRRYLCPASVVRQMSYKDYPESRLNDTDYSSIQQSIISNALLQPFDTTKKLDDCFQSIALNPGLCFDFLMRVIDSHPKSSLIATYIYSQLPTQLFEKKNFHEKNISEILYDALSNEVRSSDKRDRLLGYLFDGLKQLNFPEKYSKLMVIATLESSGKLALELASMPTTILRDIPDELFIALFFSKADNPENIKKLMKVSDKKYPVFFNNSANAFRKKLEDKSFITLLYSKGNIRVNSYIENDDKLMKIFLLNNVNISDFSYQPNHVTLYTLCSQIMKVYI